MTIHKYSDGYQGWTVGKFNTHWNVSDFQTVNILSVVISRYISTDFMSLRYIKNITIIVIRGTAINLFDK